MTPKEIKQALAKAPPSTQKFALVFLNLIPSNNLPLLVAMNEDDSVSLLWPGFEVVVSPTGLMTIGEYTNNTEPDFLERLTVCLEK